MLRGREPKTRRVESTHGDAGARGSRTLRNGRYTNSRSNATTASVMHWLPWGRRLARVSFTTCGRYSEWRGRRGWDRNSPRRSRTLKVRRCFFLFFYILVPQAIASPPPIVRPDDFLRKSSSQTLPSTCVCLLTTPPSAPLPSPPRSTSSRSQCTFTFTTFLRHEHVTRECNHHF